MTNLPAVSSFVQASRADTRFDTQIPCAFCSQAEWTLSHYPGKRAFPVTLPCKLEIEGKSIFIHLGELIIATQFNLTWNNKRIIQNIQTMDQGLDRIGQLNLLIQRISLSKIGSSLKGRLDVLRNTYHEVDNFSLFQRFQGHCAIQVFQHIRNDGPAPVVSNQVLESSQSSSSSDLTSQSSGLGLDKKFLIPDFPPPSQSSALDTVSDPFDPFSDLFDFELPFEDQSIPPLNPPFSESTPASSSFSLQPQMPYSESKKRSRSPQHRLSNISCEVINKDGTEVLFIRSNFPQIRTAVSSFLSSVSTHLLTDELKKRRASYSHTIPHFSTSFDFPTIQALALSKNDLDRSRLICAFCGQNNWNFQKSSFSFPSIFHPCMLTKKGSNPQNAFFHLGELTIAAEFNLTFDNRKITQDIYPIDQTLDKQKQIHSIIRKFFKSQISKNLGEKIDESRKSYRKGTYLSLFRRFEGHDAIQVFQHIYNNGPDPVISNQVLEASQSSSSSSSSQPSASSSEPIRKKPRSSDNSFDLGYQVINENGILSIHFNSNETFIQVPFILSQISYKALTAEIERRKTRPPS